MKFYNNNLDYTVGKYNNPYSLIQKAGLRKGKSKRKTIRNKNKHKKTRKNRK
jgi:hypothetical protein